jgi:hypothetical protein
VCEKVIEARKESEVIVRILSWKENMRWTVKFVFMIN